jgi:hypothetical protein
MQITKKHMSFDKKIFESRNQRTVVVVSSLDQILTHNQSSNLNYKDKILSRRNHLVN